MSRPDDHVVFEELAVGHALSALEPEEEHVFRGHLAACTRCQRDVAEHEITMEALASSVEPAQLPPSVLDGIRAGLSTGAPETPPAAPTAEATAPQPRVTPISHARTRRDRRRGVAARPTKATAARWVGAAAAVALVASLGAWNLALRADQQDAQDYGDRLAVAVRDLSSPSSRNVPLTSENGDVLAVAVVQDREVSLVVDGLAPNDSSTTYVLWAQDASGAVRPVGDFDVDQRQVDVVADLPVDQSAGQVTAFLVSEEPGDEAPPQPGGPVRASGQA